MTQVLLAPKQSLVSGRPVIVCGGLKVQVSRDVVGCLAPRTCLDLRLKPTQRKRSDDFGKGPVVIGTNEGLRRAHAHSQKGGGLLNR